MITILRNLRAVSGSVGPFLAIAVCSGEPLVPRAQIVGVETADARTLVLLIRDDASHPAPIQNVADYLVDDQIPTGIDRFSATLYEKKAGGQNDVFPQVVLHRLYLRLPSPATSPPPPTRLPDHYIVSPPDPFRKPNLANRSFPVILPVLASRPFHPFQIQRHLEGFERSLHHKAHPRLSLFHD
jgi:hypothetical protein